MATTQNLFNGNGSTTEFTYTFPTLQDADVKAEVDGTITTAFSLLTSPTRVKFTSAPASGTNNVRVFRDTDVDSAKAVFASGSSIRASDLNDNIDQLLYAAQEEQGAMIINSRIADDAVTASKIAVGAVNHEQLAEDAVRTVKIQDLNVTTAKIADDAVTAAKIANDAVNHEQIADDAVRLEHMSANSVDSDQYVDGSIDHVHLANDVIDGDNIQDDVINSEHIAAGAVDLEHMSANSVDSSKIVDGSIVNADINASAAIDGSKLAAATTSAPGSMSAADKTKLDGIESNATADQTNAEIRAAVEAASDSNVFTDADHSKLNAIEASATADQTAAEIRALVESASDSNVFTDADHSKLNAIEAGATADQTASEIKSLIASSPLDASHLAANSVTTSEIADAELTTLAGMQSGTASKLADSTALTADIADLNQIDGMAKETTVTDDDAKFPTSGAVVDYVAAQLAPIGGLEVIANDASFPNTQPAAGVVISIADAGGLVVSSGTSTTARTVGGSTVTINNIASNFNGSTIADGVAMMVSSTGSSQTYNYHKATLKEADLLSLSNDINDFAARYRVANSAPTSSLDEGDLWWDMSTDKLKVYDGSSWDEVASSGDFYINTISSYSGTGGNSATFNGSAYRFVLSNPGSTAQQHVVSVNGVIQKPNSGTSQPGEGFAIDGSSILFSSAPASGSDYFILTLGTTVSIGTPSDNTVATAKIQNLAVNTDKLAADAVTGAKIADDAVGAEHIERLDAALELGDDVKIHLGAGNDLRIWHNGANSFIDNDTGDFYIGGNFIGLMNAAMNEWKLKASDNGNVELYYDHSKKFETTSAGVSVTGDFQLTGANYDVKWDNANNKLIFNDNARAVFGTGTDLTIKHDGTNSFVETSTGNLYLKSTADDVLVSAADDFIVLLENNESGIRSKSAGATELYYDGTKKLETTSTGVSLSDYLFLTGDGKEIRMGAGEDLRLYHDGTDSSIKNLTGELQIRGDTLVLAANSAYEKYLTGTYNGAVELYHDNTKQLETYSNGIQLTNDLKLFDSKVLRLGSAENGDLKLYHNGTDCYIDSVTGNLNIRVNSTEVCLVAAPNGATFLYYDAVKKLETTSTGASITGRLDLSDNLDMPDDAKLILGTGDDLQIYHDGSNSFIDDAGTGNLVLRSSTFTIEDAPGGGTVGAKFVADGAVELNHNGGKKFETTSDGVGIGTADNNVGDNNTNTGVAIRTNGKTFISVNGDGSHINRNTNDGYVLHTRRAGSHVGGISVDSSSTDYITSSDYRLKENEVLISDGITRLKTLKPYRFNFKVTPDKTVDGFFAHEVTPAVPEAVKGEKDGDEMQGIDKSKLVPLLTAALQEAISKIETLETKVAALEAK